MKRSFVHHRIRSIRLSRVGRMPAILRAGDILVTVNGKYVVVEKIQHELLENPETTYNFEGEGFHTYYVGDTEVLAHNKCSQRAAMREAKRSVNIPNTEYYELISQ